MWCGSSGIELLRILLHGILRGSLHRGLWNPLAAPSAMYWGGVGDMGLTCVMRCRNPFEGGGGKLNPPPTK